MTCLGLEMALAARFCASGFPGLTASSAVGLFPCGASSAGQIDANDKQPSIAGDPHPRPGAGWDRLWSAARDREPLAEHKRLEEGVPENPVRIEGLKQRAEVWQTLVARLQCRRRDREQLAPMGSRVERRQPLLDARQ